MLIPWSITAILIRSIEMLKITDIIVVSDQRRAGYRDRVAYALRL